MLSPFKSVLPATLLFLLAASSVLAQQNRGGTGVSYGGRQLGYVPGHVKKEAHDLTRSKAAPASYQEELDPAPSMAPLEMEDMIVEDPYSTGPVVNSMGPYPYGGEYGGCNPCGMFQIWGEAEYLLWSTQGMNVPPLATTSPLGTPQAQAGVLGQPGTQVLFGGTEMNDDVRSGGRFTLGAWLDPCRCRGIQFTYIGLDTESESFAASQQDFTILARPFFNTQTNAQDARHIVFPGIVEGTLAIETSTEFQTIEVLYRRACRRNACLQVDLLMGYRYAELDDSVRFAEATTSLAAATAGARIDLAEQFVSTNEFNGAEFGLAVDYRPNFCWTWEFLAKVAVGNTRTRSIVSGQTLITDPNGGMTQTEGGLLTQPTNIGTFDDDGFGTISEFGVTLRRDFQCGLSASVGYTFLLWGDVSRAGDQIDTTINPTQIPPGTLTGPARPAFDFEDTTFWAQGLRLGLMYEF